MILPFTVLRRLDCVLASTKQRHGLGLIVRTLDGPDGRHRTLRLTAKGEALIAKLGGA